MTTINTGSYHSPTAFKGEISLPPARPREHVDTTTTVLLQNASGVAMSDLPAPQQIVFTSGVQSRLEKLASGYLPNVRKVLNECDSIQDEVIQSRREREALAQSKAWEYGYKATIETDKGSKLQRDGKFVQLSGQAAGGLVEVGSGTKGLKDKAASSSTGSKAKGHEKAVTHEKIQRDSDRRDATQLEGRIDTLEKSRNGNPADEARIDGELADTRNELARKYESINSRSKVIQEERHAGMDARKAEAAENSSDITLAMSRGMSALLNSSTGMAAAQLDHEGDLKKSNAQRLQLLRDQEESVARNSGSAADKAESARAKNLDFGAEVTRLERPADLA